MVDILVVAAHPDDAELSVAGTLLRTYDQGRRVAICDVTRGERGTRGSAELRQAETAHANNVLGIGDGFRWNLDIPDGNVEITKANTLKLVRAIRHFRPRIIMFPWERDRHPDHENTHKLVREAYFDAGLTQVETEHNGAVQLPHRPERMYTFFHTYETTPDFVVDISAQFERKLEAIAAYSSQFTVPGFSTQSNGGSEPETFISNSEFMEFIIARMRHWGFMVGARYGEAFCTFGAPLKVNDLLTTL